MKARASYTQVAEGALGVGSSVSDLSLISAYFELTKPRVTFLVVLTTAAGFYLASTGTFDYALFFHALLGTALLAGGTAGLNQYMERELDARMRRTARRPLPSRRVNPADALVFAMSLVLAGTVYLLWQTNPLTVVLGWSTCAVYLLMYTPLKTRTEHCTFVGAFPGAWPPLMGWAAASGSLNWDALILFGILFTWQFPHFHAISWVYRDDYERGGFLMLPLAEDGEKRTGRQILAYTFSLLLISFLPVWTGLSGYLYLAGALVLGLSLTRYSVRVASNPSRTAARRLLRASVIYLPLLLILMVIDKVS